MYWVTTLTFQGHVMLLVTWPLESHFVVLSRTGLSTGWTCLTWQLSIGGNGPSDKLAPSLQLYGGNYPNDIDCVSVVPLSLVSCGYPWMIAWLGVCLVDGLIKAVRLQPDFRAWVAGKWAAWLLLPPNLNIEHWTWFPVVSSVWLWSMWLGRTLLQLLTLLHVAFLA